MTDNVRSMLRRQRCRQLAHTSLVLWVVGILGTFAGLSLSRLGAAPYAGWLALVGGVVAAVAFANILALYEWRPAQWFIKRLGGHGGERAVWDEPWYSEETPFGSLLSTSLLIDRGDES